MNRLLDIPQVQERVPIGRTTLFALLASGALESVRIGARRLVPEDALDTYIAGLRDDPTRDDER